MLHVFFSVLASPTCRGVGSCFSIASGRRSVFSIARTRLKSAQGRGREECSEIRRTIFGKGSDITTITQNFIDLLTFSGGVKDTSNDRMYLKELWAGEFISIIMGDESNLRWKHPSPSWVVRLDIVGIENGCLLKGKSEATENLMYIYPHRNAVPVIIYAALIEIDSA